MGSTEHSYLFGVFIFFLTLNTIVVGLRLYVRLWLKKSVFGWDDVFLVITYIGLILFVMSALMAIQNGVMNYHIAPRNLDEATRWTAIMTVVCYVISGTVKISVAVVIYRLLDYRPVLRAIIVTDIVVCFTWTLVSTLVCSLGCTGSYISPYTFSPAVCHNMFYAQEASYIFFDTFHVVFPISILWNVQIKGGQKTSVIILFSIGLLSTIAAVLKLAVIIEVFRVPATGRYQDFWQRAVTWSVSEHGLSLFAAAILALRPLCGPITQGWTSLSDTVSQLYTSSRRDSWVSRPNSAGTAPSSSSILSPTAARKPSWAAAWAAISAGSRSAHADSSPSSSWLNTQGSTERPSTSSATPRAYLARVSETEHRMMLYRSSDPTGGRQWNWTNQWPTEFGASSRSGASPSAAPTAPGTPGAVGSANGARHALTLLPPVSYDWPPSPTSINSSSENDPLTGSYPATCNNNKNDKKKKNRDKNNKQSTVGPVDTTTTSSSSNSNNKKPETAHRNTPDYFTCVVEANERNMTVQEYLRTLGVSSRLTDRESPGATAVGAGEGEGASIHNASHAAAAAAPSTPGNGGINWFEGRRLSHMLL